MGLIFNYSKEQSLHNLFVQIGCDIKYLQDMQSGNEQYESLGKGEVPSDYNEKLSKKFNDFFYFLSNLAHGQVKCDEIIKESAYRCIKDKHCVDIVYILDKIKDIVYDMREKFDDDCGW